MAGENDFKITIETDKIISSTIFAQKFLKEWLAHPVEQIRPECWGRGEPVRKQIADIAFDTLVAEWGERPLVFVKHSKPKIYADLNWRHEKGLDPRPFPWGLTAWLDRSGGPSLARTFFDFVVEKFEPAFASLTTQADIRQKHFVKWPRYIKDRQVGTAEAFKGSHILDKLPGIYWITYFGPSSINLIGRERFESLSIGKIRTLGEGLVIIAYDDFETIGSALAKEKETSIRDYLGPDLFFDRRAWVPPTV